MALQSSGAISLNDIQTEFGGSNPIGINEYYGVAPGIPSSGQISIGDFYGASSTTPASGPFTLELLVIAGGGRAQHDNEAGGTPGGAGAGGMYFVTIPGVSPGTTIPISLSPRGNPTVTPYVTVAGGGKADATPSGLAVAYPGGSGAGQGYPSAVGASNNPATTGGLGNDPPVSPAQGNPGFTYQNPGPITTKKGGGGGGYLTGGPRTTFQHNGGTGYTLNNFVTDDLLHGGSPLVPGHPIQVCYGGGGHGYGGNHGSPGWPGLAAARSNNGTGPWNSLRNGPFDSPSTVEGTGLGWGGLGDADEGGEFYNEGTPGAIFIRYEGSSSWPNFGGRIQNNLNVNLSGLPYSHPNGTNYICHVVKGTTGASSATQLKVVNAPGPY